MCHHSAAHCFTCCYAGGLSEDQIQQMVRDAEQYAEKDKERKELIEARNEADTLAYSVDKSLQEYKVRSKVRTCIVHKPALHT
jgi:molecular chaperone DnaK (HSP70)